jgi:hypothetical protein
MGFSLPWNSYCYNQFSHAYPWHEQFDQASLDQNIFHSSMIQFDAPHIGQELMPVDIACQDCFYEYS